jgi:hypothetical protein
MHLRPNELVFGVAPEILLDCAQQLRDGERPFSLDDFSRALGAPLDESAPVLQQMLAHGFLLARDDGTFGRTQKFSQLAAASISEGLTRSAAETLLGRIVTKAHEINERVEEYEARVQCIVVFGSYLGDKPLLGDLDIGVDVAELPRVREGRLKFSELRQIMTHQTPSGRVFSELRLRKPKLISVHRLGEVIELSTPYKVVFGQLPAKASDEP